MKLTETILLARELMERHKLNDWKLKFDESKSHIGLCRYSEKTIYLSYPYVEINEEKIIRNTILHEIAHALAGSRNGHNRIWRTIAKSIGCTGERCTSGADKPRGKWTRCCNNCGYEQQSYRRTSKKRACGKCCNDYNGGRYAEEYKLEWRLNKNIYNENGKLTK
jgi:predicted SprT family Zn-dependent metalloprotease